MQRYKFNGSGKTFFLQKQNVKENMTINNRDTVPGVYLSACRDEPSNHIEAPGLSLVSFQSAINYISLWDSYLGKCLAH